MLIHPSVDCKGKATLLSIIVIPSRPPPYIIGNVHLFLGSLFVCTLLLEEKAGFGILIWVSYCFRHEVIPNRMDLDPIQPQCIAIWPVLPIPMPPNSPQEPQTVTTLDILMGENLAWHRF
eukprot:scaffold15298_cov49-Attheya_sp.AAC.3